MSPANRAKLHALYKSEFEQVRGWARRALRDPELAEDLAQTAFHKLGEAMERGQSNNAGLLRVILHGLLVNHWQQAEARPEEVSLNEAVHHYTPGPVPFFPGEFDASVRELSEQDRSAYILTDLRGLNHGDAAVVLDVPLRTVERRLQRARTYLREELAA